ncbi:MAG: hypothetical protein ACF8OB_13010 [Phycisphaeraceae bacterium JB051]
MTVQLSGLGLRLVTGLCIAWSLFLSCAHLKAQPATFYKDERQYAHQRLIHKFDFEEARFGNFEDMPGYWHRIGAPSNLGMPHFDQQPLHQQMTTLKGYPTYTQVRFNIPQNQKGDHSLYMGLNGGNAGAYLEVGAIPAVPNSDYRITARVKTARLDHASAKFTVYFIDGKGRVVQDSVVTTGLFKSNDKWLDLSMKLNGDFSPAAWIGMQVELLQERRDKNSLLGEKQVIFNEVDGGVWIDDIAIWQLPNISLSTQSKVNILRHPEKPNLTVKVRDLSGRRLVSTLTVYDYRRNLLDTRSQEVGAGSPNAWTHQPTLPGYGWYLADLIVSETKAIDGSDIQQPVARTLCGFLWLPSDKPAHLGDARRFSLRAVDVPDIELPMIPDLVQKAGIYGVTISPWRRDTSTKNIEFQQNQLDDLLHPLIAENRDVIFSLHPIPDLLKSELQQSSLQAHMLFDQDVNIWSAYFKPVILRHSQRVRQWELGSVLNPTAMYHKDLLGLIGRVRYQFQTLAPNPRLILPWNILEPPHEFLGKDVGYVLKVPEGVHAEHLKEFWSDWTKQGDVPRTLMFQVSPADELSQQDRVNDLALRMLRGWEITQSGMMINKPWTVSDRRDVVLMPDPTLGVFASLSNRLCGRRVVKYMNMGRGIKCMILDGTAGGMLAFWNESAPQHRTDMTMHLGVDPKWHDLWGNHLPMTVEDGKQSFKVTGEPMFMEDIDTELALFRASFVVDRPFIESRQIPHNRVVKLHNPWNHTISGHITFLEPKKWRISPKRMFFSMAANADYEIPIQLSFPISETAGHKELVARVEFVSQKRYDVNFTTPLELGLKDIDFYSHLTIESNPKTGTIDALVTQRIANRGTQVISLYSFANMTGYSRQERLISQLHPGESIIRNFRFLDGAQRLKTQSVRTGLRETSGPAVINHNLSARDLVTR